MKEGTNNTIIYTAQDIQKYLSGGYTPAEMHAIEKAALDDPFLAEAIEGFEAMKDKSWETELAAARLKVAQGNVAKVVPFGKNKNDWWKIAAAVAILLGGSLVYNFTQRSTKITNTKKEIAKVDNRFDTIKNKAQAVTSDTATITASSSDVASVHATELSRTKAIPTTLPSNGLSAQRSNPADSRLVAMLKDTTDGIRANDYAYRPPVVADNDGITNVPTADKKYFAEATSKERKNIASTATVDQSKNIMPAAAPTNGYSNTTFDQFSKPKAAEASMAKKSAAIQYNHPFNAQVLGTDNQPLPFANVSIKTENFGTYADVKGNFKLVSTDSLITVQVKSVGYLPRQFVLKSNGQQNKLVLSEDQAAAGDMTVIKGRVPGTATRRARLVRDSVVNAEPADGWDNYTTYISNNLDPYGALINESAHGEMEITFRVKSDYTITDIKVDNSLCNNCDEEAVRKLIEQGPQWKTKKGKTGKAKIKVQF